MTFRSLFESPKARSGWLKSLLVSLAILLLLVPLETKTVQNFLWPEPSPSPTPGSTPTPIVSPTPTTASPTPMETPSLAWSSPGTTGILGGPSRDTGVLLITIGLSVVSTATSFLGFLCSTLIALLKEFRERRNDRERAAREREEWKMKRLEWEEKREKQKALDEKNNSTRENDLLL